MKLAFIGLGAMGKYMALNLVKSGELTLVSARTDRAFPEFEARNIPTSTRAEDAAEADLIFLCLPDAAVVSDTVEKLKPLLRPGQIIVDTSTIKYQTALRLQKELAEMGVSFLDAPISGLESRAKDGTLTIMVGGDEEVFRTVLPYFELMGKNILYMGGPGSGQLTKLINQLLYDINMAAIAEIMPMAVKMGLDSEKITAVVNSGTGRSHASEYFLPNILKGSFHNSYPMKSAYKDLVSAAGIGAELGIPMPVLAAATATYQQALLRGFGDCDKGGMIRVYEELLGVEFRAKEQD